jgi:phytoene dehydrogenase-like protein
MKDVAIVGGGIAGLTAATILGRSAKSVILYEQNERPGGRAGTSATPDGFSFNFGPHALYRSGHAERVLGEIGVSVPAHKVGTAGSFAVFRDTVYPLPVGLLGLLASHIFGWKGRLEALQFLARLGRISPRALDRITVGAWIDGELRDSVARLFANALVRVSSYTNAPQQMSAGAAVEQLQLAFTGGVSYVDGGWQTLVRALRETAINAGAELRTASRVRSLEYMSGELQGVRLDDGTLMRAGAVVLAVPPLQAVQLLGHYAGRELRQWTDGHLAVQAACLDLALRSLPRTERTFALGIDQPIYLSVHSRWAQLAPEGAALVHVAKYLPAGGETDPATDRAQLEAFMERVQPGWRNQVLHERWFPKMPVTHGLVRAQGGGFNGRPAVHGAGSESVFLAGDWVGAEGMLADAAFASASRAAKAVIARGRPMLHAVAV